MASYDYNNSFDIVSFSQDKKRFSEYQNAQNASNLEKVYAPGKIEKLAREYAWEYFYSYFQDSEYDLIGIARVSNFSLESRIAFVLARVYKQGDFYVQAPQMKVWKRWFIFYFQNFWDARLPERYRRPEFKEQTKVKIPVSKEIKAKAKIADFEQHNRNVKAFEEAEQAHEDLMTGNIELPAWLLSHREKVSKGK